MTRTTTALRVLLFSLMVSSAAHAASGFVFNLGHTLSLPYAYQFEVVEYQSNTANRNELPALCSRYNANTLPIVLFFGGGNGAGGGKPWFSVFDPSAVGNEIDVLKSAPGRVGLAETLMNQACTRVLYVRSLTGYETGTSPDQSRAVTRVQAMAYNIGRVVEDILTNSSYSSATRVTIMGGSASALHTAHLLGDKFSQLIGSSPPWNKVKRFVLGGPHGGNLATACQHAQAGSLVDGTAMNLVGGSCATYLARAGIDGRMYLPATSAQIGQASSAGIRIDMFIGDQDEAYGPAFGTNIGNTTIWTGPSGVWDFMSSSNLYWTQFVYIGYAPPGYEASLARASIAEAVLLGVNHSGTWQMPLAEKAVCYMAAFDSLGGTGGCPP